MFVSMAVCGPTLTFELSKDSVGVGCTSMTGVRSGPSSSDSLSSRLEPAILKSLHANICVCVCVEGRGGGKEERKEVNHCLVHWTKPVYLSHSLHECGSP